jgi:hypothetical protein
MLVGLAILPSEPPGPLGARDARDGIQTLGQQRYIARPGFIVE